MFAELPGIEVVYRGQRVHLVEAGSNVAILDVGEPAQMNDELRLTSLRGQVVARSFHVAIRQTQSLARLSEVRPSIHAISPDGLPGGLVIIAGDHSVTNPEQRYPDGRLNPMRGFVARAPL